jgi:PKD repeat protein
MSRSTRGTSALVAAFAALALLFGVAAPVASASASTSRASVVDWTQVPGARASDLIVTPYNGYLSRFEAAGFSYNARDDGISSYCADHPNPYLSCPADYSDLLHINSVVSNTIGATVNLTLTDPTHAPLTFLTSMDGDWEQTSTSTTHAWLWDAPITTGTQQGQLAYYQQICQLDVPCTVGFSLRDRYGIFYGDQFVATNAGGRELYIPLHPVTGPTAAFTSASSSTSDHGQYQFVSTSSSPTGDALTSAWDFGDGTTSTAGSVTHSFTKPGTYHVKLTVTDQGGLSNSVSHDVVITAPKLTVTPTVVGSADVSPGDPVNVDVLVAASSDGVGDLTALQWGSTTPAGLSSAPADAVTALSASSTLPSSLSPGQSVTLHYTAAAGDDLTTAALTSTVTGMDAAGTPLSASGSVNLKVALHALKVTISSTDDPVHLAFDATTGAPVPEDEHVSIVITNTSDAAVDGVAMDPLDLSALDPTHPYATFPATVAAPNGSVSIGTIDGGASVTLHRTVHVTDAADLSASTLVTSASDTVLGKAEVHATLLQMTMQWAMDKRWDGTPATIISTPEQLASPVWGFTAQVEDGCGTSDAHAITLTIGGAAPDDLSTTGDCVFHFTRTNLDPFTLTAARIVDGRTTSSGSTRIQGRDFFIVAAGDSLSSGEGLGAQTWSLQQCHRAVSSGSGRAALLLEDADPHTAVDYASVACSGASTDVGLIGPYVGIEPGSSLEPQLRVVQAMAAVRPIDSLVFSTGANDVDFGDVVKSCLVSPAIGCDGSTWLSGTRNPIGPFLTQQFAELPGHYAAINQYVTAAGVSPDHVIALTYPDSTHSDASGNPYCTSTMTALSWEYAHDTILSPLNRAVQTAAAAYGWKVVSGAEQAFLDHGYCSSDPWITTITESALTEFAAAGAFHPNDAGYVWYGDQIFAQQKSMLYVDGTPVAAPTGSSRQVVATGTLSAGTVQAGGTVTVSGDGFSIGEAVSVELHSTPVHVGSTSADFLSHVSTTVTIPATTPPGQHAIVLTGLVSGNTVSIPILVTAGSTSAALASTGSDPSGGVVTGLLALLTGLLIVGARILTRRRNTGG